MKTPVTLITGFLGAGKTTLVNALLRQTREKIILIINEFGDISIDDRLISTETEEMIQLASGSICCAVKDDLIQVLTSLMDTGTEKAKTFDRIIIETTGLADPVPLVEAFAKKPGLYTRYMTPTVITVIDAFHIAEQLQSNEEAIPQIAMADTVLINKIDLVPSVEDIELLVRRINPFARILTSQHSEISVDVLLDTDWSREAVENRQTALGSDLHESGGHEAHIHSSNIETFVLRENRPLDLQRIGLFIAEHILLHAERYIRYKGILYINGMEERFVFQGVHMQFENRRDRPWHEGEERVSEVVIIGKDLDRDRLKEAFSKCIST